MSDDTMADYQRRIVHKMEALGFEVYKETSEALGYLELGKFEEAGPVLMHINFLSMEMVRLHRKLLNEE